jgi:hypothetical protein
VDLDSVCQRFGDTSYFHFENSLTLLVSTLNMVVLCVSEMLATVSTPTGAKDHQQ